MYTTSYPDAVASCDTPSGNEVASCCSGLLVSVYVLYHLFSFLSVSQITGCKDRLRMDINCAGRTKTKRKVLQRFENIITYARAQRPGKYEAPYLQ